MMATYVYDTNAILVQPLKIITVTVIVQAYENIFKFFTASGFIPIVHWIDNESSELLKTFDRS